MSNIIRFTNGDNPDKTHLTAADKKVFDARIKGGCNKIFQLIWKFVWVVTILVWPIFKWVLCIEVFFQFVRTIYLWNSPNTHAGWTFLLHFTILTVITYFVSSHKPKRI